MKTVFKRLSTTISALAASTVAQGAFEDSVSDNAVTIDPYDGLTLHGLVNDGKLPGYLAGHRSHSSHGSHGSHGSHRSSAGSSRPAVPSSPAPRSVPTPKPSDPLGQPPKPAQTYRPAIPDVPVLQSNKELRATVVQQIQGKLKLLGYYTGAVDGVMGPLTRDAIDVYKIAKGLPRGGYLDMGTLNALGIRIP